MKMPEDDPLIVAEVVYAKLMGWRFNGPWRLGDSQRYVAENLEALGYIPMRPRCWGWPRCWAWANERSYSIFPVDGSWWLEVLVK